MLPRQPGMFGQDFTIRPTPSHFSLKFHSSPFLVSYNGTHQPMGQTREFILVRCRSCSWGKKGVHISEVHVRKEKVSILVTCPYFSGLTIAVLGGRKGDLLEEVSS